MILEKIVQYKKEELEHFKRQHRLEELKASVRDAVPPLAFRKALVESRQRFSIIAEIKKKSPSKGVLRESFDPVSIARDYAENGAAALSVLTDENFFGGHLDHLRQVRQAVAIPLLRKDFIWDPYQVYAARDAGADAILLIAAMLEKTRADDLMGLGGELGLTVLFEIHEVAEAKLAGELKADLVGINNRDLKTFRVDIQTTENCLPLLPKDSLKVSESGIDGPKLMERLKGQGVGAFLIGEAFMTAPHPGRALKEFLNGTHPG